MQIHEIVTFRGLMFIHSFIVIISEQFVDEAELIDSFEICKWYESQKDKDVTPIDLKNQCRHGFSLPFRVAGDQAILKLVNCDETQSDWTISKFGK